jgi:hypothetical protein
MGVSIAGMADKLNNPMGSILPEWHIKNHSEEGSIWPE